MLSRVVRGVIQTESCKHVVRRGLRRDAAEEKWDGQTRGIEGEPGWGGVDERRVRRARLRGAAGDS